MALAPLPEVTVTPVTHLPEKYFPENLVVRADGSVLITALLSKELINPRRSPIRHAEHHGHPMACTENLS